MDILTKEQAISKDPVIQDLFENNTSPLKKYQSYVIGSSALADLIKYEFVTMFLGSLPGGIGLLLRKIFYPGLLRNVGANLTLGRNIVLRHPGKIEIGERVLIDDDCLVDAKGTGDQGIKIGSDVLIARSTIIQSKNGPIVIGNRCNIGSQCQLASVGGISLGEAVMIAGQCYIGGGRYYTKNQEIPMMDQGLYSHGPVVIGDDVWLGAGVIVQDGVRIGKGCVVGSGVVVTEDLPEFAIAVPNRKLLLLARGESIQ